MRLALIALLLAPVLAHAAPVIAALPLVLSGTALVVAQIVLTVGMLVYGSAKERKAARRQRDEHNAALQERTVSKIATEAPHVYVYGRAKVGSSVVAMFTSGDKDQYKHLVCVHAAHECDGIEEVYIAGQKLGPLDANGYPTSGPFIKTETLSTFQNFQASAGQTLTLLFTPVAIGSVRYNGSESSELVPYTVSGNVVTVTSGPEPSGTYSVSYRYLKHTPHVRVRKHLGAPDDPADATLMAELPSKWTSNAVLRGFCYTVIRLDLNEPEFQGGPPTVEVLVRGKKLYDFRTGTTAWSQNNALVAYDYLTSELCGVDSSDLPMAQFIAAANVCDEVQSFGPRYTFNGTVTSDEDQKGVLERMAQSMAGGIVSTTWDIWAGKYLAPVMALEQSDIVGQIAITPGISDADLYNGVRGQYISSETEYVATDFVPFQNDTYVDADKRELWTNIDFPYTDTLQRVHNLCRIFTEDQRNGYTVKADFSLKAWSLKVGQRITLTSSFFGWNTKIYRVTDKKYSPNSAVELTLKEDAAEIWDFADAVTVDATPNTGLPNPFDIDPLASIECSSGTDALLQMQDGTVLSRILVTWPQATTQSVVTNGQIELEWLRLGTDVEVWLTTSVKGNETHAFLSDVEDGQIYVVRARTYNPYLNTRSDWVYAEDHQVLGKTEPPPNITDLSISGSILNWTVLSRAEVPDLAGYIFRFHYGSNFDWGTAAPLHAGLIVSSPFDLVTRPGGIVTIMGKAIDSSGNESLATGNIVTNLGDPPIGNVVEEFDFHADGFPGTHENCAVVAGDLIASETDSAYGTDSQSFYGADNDPAYDLSSYAQMVYTTNEIPILSALAGSVMTIEQETQGVDLFIEYQLVGPGSAYGPDSDSAYGADEEPFYDSPSPWIPWPGQIIATNDVYRIRVTLGAGPTQGKITALKLTIDAPDIVEYLNDVLIGVGGTVVPYTSNFTEIKTVTPTLQANSSGAETIEVDKSINLSPVVRAYNSSHVAVGGATADIIVKGY